MVSINEIDVPDDLVAAIVAEAQRDAIRVAHFLDHWNGKVEPIDKPMNLDAAALVDLGAGVRIGAWERAGLVGHLDAGLPAARDALVGTLNVAAEAIKAGKPRPASAARLMPRVLAVWIDCFAWHAPAILGADVVLGDADEDLLVDAMAEFIWSQRNSLQPERE